MQKKQMSFCFAGLIHFSNDLLQNEIALAFSRRFRDVYSLMRWFRSIGIVS